MYGWIVLMSRKEENMETRKEPFFDMPMMLSLLAVLFIVIFILYAGRNRNQTESGYAIAAQRDSVEVVVSENQSLTFSD